jgi:hypothetical protein
MPPRSLRTCSRGHEFKGEEPCPVCWPGYRTFKVRCKVWLYPGEAAWHFASVPEKESAQMRERFAGIARGWGSLKVHVTIGDTSWKTSVFPDKKSGCYMLPLKAEVRKKEGIVAGKTVQITLEVQE